RRLRSIGHHRCGLGGQFRFSREGAGAMAKDQDRARCFGEWFVAEVPAGRISAGHWPGPVGSADCIEQTNREFVPKRRLLGARTWLAFPEWPTLFQDATLSATTVLGGPHI